MSPVLDLPAPKSKLLISRGHGRFTADANKVISTHYYNKKCQLLLPIPQHRSQVPIDEITTLFGQHTFKHQQVLTPLTRFIEVEFLDEYIRKHSFMMLSCDCTLDGGDVVAITPDGRMVFNLTKDAYERAGLTGTKSKFHDARHGGNERYQVVIDISSPSFKPTSKLYDRVLWCLAHTILSAPRECLVSCHSRTTGEFIEMPFSSSASKTYHTMPKIAQIQGVMTPDMKQILADQSMKKYATMTKEEKRMENDKLEELFEWLGMVTIDSPRIGFMNQVNPFICVYEHPDTSTGPHNLLTFKWEGGFITPSCIQKVVQDLQNIITKYNAVPWASFMVWGYPDAPISWDKYEHGYDTSGENDYACVFRQEQGWVMYQAVGSFDAVA
ncbi:hypothetical protein SeMB42_g02506 [Synchytrium endobioticum]|uniref:Uncharacterized protein n=1 Tax=Synchytrium endobioticum TaxID=286115 RepID=A0A507DE72_9FUNG|nr:hypothetical protein SeLEV6574_g02272 [Synchytrium endobioticum]TPX49711.1 hypothetical protein SeMB42_g02506 [Synchytrium endobioticum]